MKCSATITIEADSQEELCEKLNRIMKREILNIEAPQDIKNLERLVDASENNK